MATTEASGGTADLAASKRLARARLEEKQRRMKGKEEEHGRINESCS